MKVKKMRIIRKEKRKDFKDKNYFLCEGAF
jgi:hypothetical protein